MLKFSKSKAINASKKVIATVLTIAVITAIATTFAIASTARRNVSGQQGGVNVVVNGQRLNLSAADEPVTIGGRTFLPVRALADATGLDIGWDGATSTVSITTDGTAPATTLPAPAPTTTGTRLHSASPSGRWWGSSWITVQPNMVIRGVSFTEPMIYASNTNYTYRTDFALNQQYSTLNLTIGRIDASRFSNINVAFFGDNNALIDRVIVGANDTPRTVTIDVSSVRQLRMEVGINNIGAESGNTQWAISGFLN